MDNLNVMITEDEIQEKVAELAKQIDKDYEGKEPVIISVLNGAVFFTTDLLKKMKTPVELQFVQVSSYKGTESTGEIKMKKDLDISIKGRDVLIVEDIIDTGHTLKSLKSYLLSKNPASLKIACLNDKKARRQVDMEADYVVFNIEDKFVVGYGLDYNDKYRNLPYIGYFERIPELEQEDDRDER